MSSIIKHVLAMLPYVLIAAVPIFVFRAVRICVLSKRKTPTTFWHEMGIILFLLFMVGLFSQTIIPRLEFSGTGIGIVQAGDSGINLIPFKIFADSIREFQTGNRSYFIINLLGNIGMFLPIGFFIPLLWRERNFRSTVLITFLVSLFIELCQLPQSRWTDIDDLWMNTLGGVAGYGVYWGIKRLFPELTAKFKVKGKRED